MGFKGSSCIEALVVVVVTIMLQSVHASEIYVKPGTLDVINTAITKAVSGDTITMLPGTYTDCSKIILLNKHLTIRGPGALFICI